MSSSVSVIVPTYRRARDVLRCLGSLAAQDVGDFEVIVADNACEAELEREVASLSPGAARAFRYLPVPELGLHNARHAGARAADGDLLLFTDDDADCTTGWVGAYASAFAALPEAAAAGGPVEARWEEPPPPWLLELATRRATFTPLALMTCPYDEVVVPERGFFYGVNMAIRRDALFAVGGFNPESFGAGWLGDGESGLNRKLWEGGFAVAYVPDARVRHWIPAERMTLAYLRRRWRNEGAADVYTLLRPFAFRRRGLVRLLLRTVRDGAPIWLRAGASRGRTDPRSLDLQFRAARRAGSFAYLVRLLRDDELWPLVRRERWLEADPS